jgi:hypothetical protein
MNDDKSYPNWAERNGKVLTDAMSAKFQSGQISKLYETLRQE